MTALERFRELFWDGFSRPTLYTDRFKGLWGYLELNSGVLAGPLHTIFERGNCDYVFDPAETRFEAVRTADDFLRWCLESVEYHRNITKNYEPVDELEIADRESLLKQGDIMEELSNLAYTIMKERLHDLGR